MSVQSPELQNAPPPVAEGEEASGPPSEPPRRRRYQLLVAAAIVAAALGFTLSRLGPDEGPAPQSAPPASPATVRFLMEQQWLVRMKLAVAEARSVRRQVHSTGRVVPAFRHHAVVSSPVSGVLTGAELPRVGQSVEKGQRLARVVSSPEVESLGTSRALLEIERARLEAEKRRLTQRSNEARARMLLAIVEADHAQRLFDRKAYSLNQYQRAQHELKVAETDYDSARRELEALEALTLPHLAEAESLGERSVDSPLSGTVVSLHKQIGERAGAGEPILEIVDLTRVWVEAPVFERDLPRIEGSLAVFFTTAAEPDRRFEGKLVDVGAVVDETTRAATVLFEVENPERRLRIGMQANVFLETGERFEAIVIPREAVLEVEGLPSVYVLVSGEEFERRQVRLADIAGEQAVVLDGLHPGERVVTQGAYPIRLQELSPRSPASHTH